MTDREKELDWLYRLRSKIYVYMPKEWLTPMRNALDMAIEALEQEPRLKAKWIDNSDGGRIWNPFQDRYTCSNCGRHSDLENYCCNCGAEMEDE